MAADHPMFTYSMPAGSTGIAKYRFVAGGAGGTVVCTVGGLGVIGVTQTTFSSATTVDNRWGTFAGPGALLKVSAPASTLSAGDRVSCSSRGQAIPVAAGYNELGTVVSGSSGGAGRILSVMVTLAGTT